MDNVEMNRGNEVRTVNSEMVEFMKRRGWKVASKKAEKTLEPKVEEVKKTAKKEKSEEKKVFSSESDDLL